MNWNKINTEMKDNLNVFKRMQLEEYDHADGVTLKTDKELEQIIIDFGHGVTKFHTVDVNRLLVENQKLKELLRFDEPWSLVSILEELVHASEILLQTNNYDGHGWELKQQAQFQAQQMINKSKNL